uniref:Putative secreted protein n=1 Tax=Anopheles triannulatus TaxID=58253 RepID=A0A2M4B7D0_9DIPT
MLCFELFIALHVCLCWQWLADAPSEPIDSGHPRLTNLLLLHLIRGLSNRFSRGSVKWPIQCIRSTTSNSSIT